MPSAAPGTCGVRAHPASPYSSPFPCPQGLGLERYQAVFEEQEIDLAVVHAVSGEELAGIGVTDRLHQVGGMLGRLLCPRAHSCCSPAKWQLPIMLLLLALVILQARIVQAADALATKLGLRRLRGAAGGGGGKPAAAKKQRQLTLLPANGTLPAEDDGAVQQHQQQQQGLAQPPPFQQQRQVPVDASMSEAAPRPQERALLASLYPAAAGAAGGGPAGAQQAAQQPPQRTPQLAGGRTVARAAPAAASLWAGAGACMPVAPTLAARLAQREAADPEAAAARKQPLARGGTAYPVGEESRALKVGLAGRGCGFWVDFQRRRCCSHMRRLQVGTRGALGGGTHAA